MRVKGNHPLAEILGKKLLGIEIVPKDEQVKMVNRAIKAAVEWVNSNQDDIKLVCEYILKEHEALQNLITGWGETKPCPCNICVAAKKLMEG
jgi:hypothetical protein